MKKEIVALVLMILCSISLSNVQGQDLNKGEYLPVEEFKLFEGQWVYEGKGESFRILLVKERVYVDQVKTYTDVIQGTHTHSKGGNVLQNSHGKQLSITYGRIHEDGNNKITFFVSDLNKKKRGTATLELIPGKTDEARWVLTNREGIRVGKSDPAFSLPTDVVMKKVK